MKVAIVEDEKKLVYTLEEGLRAEGYETTSYYDGESFLEALTNGDVPDVVVLDFGLPHMNGREVSRAMRAKNILTPILILTAYDTIADKVEALESGADDFLAKPFSFEELVARLRALVRRANTQGATSVVIGDMTLDMNTRSVVRKGERIELTPTEFDLLYLLVQNRDRPISREEISKTLWDVRDLSLSNIVDVHISNLRKKIDGNHATQLIWTVRGLGYRIA